jgi:hypothetical protein
MTPSDQLALAIYEATIDADRPFVPIPEIENRLRAEGIDCGAAAANLIQRGFLDGSFGGAYALSPAGISHVEQFLTLG